MARNLFKASSLLALIAMGACAGSSDVNPSGAAGTTGAAGNNGGAGTTGVAGNVGSTGDAGTTGVAGSNMTGSAGTGGTAGTTGTAGRGGTTGVAGSTGGTTGMAGASGSTGMAGRGGTTGVAGAAGGRGGTTGTAGSVGPTGGGGAGGCTITATSMLGTIPTVGIVTFTTNLTGITAAEIRFGPASTGPTMIAPVDLAQTNYRTLLLGMKGGMNYVYRIVASSGAGTCTSQDYTIMTGAVPSSVIKPTTTIMNAAAHSKGFMVTSSGISGTGAWIFDSDGAPVWWSTGPTGTSRIEMSWDGSKMYMMALNVQNSGQGRVNIVNMDGSNMTMASGMTASHHDLTAIPGGFATLLWNSTGIDAPCSMVERADDGTMKTIVADMNSIYSAPGGKYHTNSIHYYPSDNTYTLGDRNPNAYVKITRTGTLIWQFGGGSPKDMSKFFSGVPTWSVNHGHHMLADGSFILFNNGAMSGASSVARAFKLNTTNMTATSTLTYMASGVNSNVMGDAQFLPNGNILVTFSQSGQINEITSSGQLVASFKTTAFGYTEYRDSLYGPPPR